jgi:imidazolonepropionase
MHYQPARKIIDAGLPVAVASDYNPGSCPSGNMNLILSLACSQMRMTPEEAINACTINGAAAMEVNDKLEVLKLARKPILSSQNLFLHWRICLMPLVRISLRK